MGSGSKSGFPVIGLACSREHSSVRRAATLPVVNAAPEQNKGQLEWHAKDNTSFTRDLATPELRAVLSEGTTATADMREALCITTLHQELIAACDAVNAGNMRLPERMAMAQAHTLDHLFHRLTNLAFNNVTSIHHFHPTCAWRSEYKHKAPAP